MATTEEDVRVTMEAGGRRAETTLGELGRVARALGEMQLSLDVGGDMEEPAASTFKISGELATRVAELPKGADVVVTVTSLDGEIIVHGRGYVRSVSFVDHFPRDLEPWVERAHAIKLGERG